MAKVYEDAAGLKIVFTDHDGNRRTLRMAKLSKRDMESVSRRIERLVSAKMSGEQLDGETARWLAGGKDGCGDKLRERLEKLDMCAPRVKTERATLKAFLDAYIASRTDVKSGTKVNAKAAVDCLVEFFGADRPIDQINPGDAVEYRLWLLGKRGLAENTARRHCGRAKQYFRHAIKKRLIVDNPFDDLPTRVQASDESRDHYVTREEIRAILEQCPDAEWRGIVVLARFGGLRIPSESTQLRWQDVDFVKGIIRVTSPKTSRHAGHQSRMIPLFPELRPALQELYDLVPEGPESEFVFRRLRGRDSNLRTRLTRIMARAGVTVFEKPFHNCRASRAIELSQDWPAHVVEAWLGHTEAVAKRHYLRVQPDDFARAAGLAQKLATNLQELSGTEGKQQDGTVWRSQSIPVDSVQFHSVTCTKAPRLGSDQLADLSVEIGVGEIRPPKNGNDSRCDGILGLLERAASVDPRILDLLARWPGMAPADRAEILARLAPREIFQ